MRRCWSGLQDGDLGKRQEGRGKRQEAEGTSKRPASGTACAPAWRMKAKKLDDVLVYKKSLVGADAVSAMLERLAFRRDFKLKDQLSQSSSRTVALIDSKLLRQCTRFGDGNNRPPSRRARTSPHHR